MFFTQNLLQIILPSYSSFLLRGEGQKIVAKLQCSWFFLFFRVHYFKLLLLLLFRYMVREVKDEVQINIYRPRESIPYRRLYRFGQWYDIFRIPVYRFGFIAIFYIYKYICVCVCVIINIKVYHKTFH